MLLQKVYFKFPTFHVSPIHFRSFFFSTASK